MNESYYKIKFKHPMESIELYTAFIHKNWNLLHDPITHNLFVAQQMNLYVADDIRAEASAVGIYDFELAYKRYCQNWKGYLLQCAIIGSKKHATSKQD